MKNYNFLICLTFFACFCNLCFSQNYEWAKSIGSADTDFGYSIAVDGSGNVYITGYFSDTADFDLGAGTANLMAVGFYDIFIAKYDAGGNYLWAKSIGSTGIDIGISIAVDDTGNVYITGTFQGIADFDPDAGTANLTPVGSLDVFFAKYDTNGNYIWAKNIGGTGADEVKCIVIDSSGSVYLTGCFWFTADFDPGTGIANLTSAANRDLFFAKYNNNGDYILAKSIGGIGSEFGYSIAVDNSNNIYITGHFEDTTDFDPGIGTANLLSMGALDIFFAKYDNNGNYLWTNRIGDIYSDWGRSIAVDGSGNVYITGQFDGPADFDPGNGTANLTGIGSYDIFFAKYNSNGNYIWAKAVGSVTNDFGGSIAIDVTDNVYVSGAFSGTADFNPGTGTANLTSAGNNDIFFAKYDAGGNYVWAKKIGNTGNDVCNGLVIGNIGDVYITGGFNINADFDPGTGTANLTSNGMTDIFLAKYSQLTGITEPETGEKERFRIYPNPAKDKVTINTEASKEIAVSIFNIQGGKIMNNSFQNQNLIEIDVSKLTKGIYFIKTQTDNNVEINKLIIQ